MVVPHGTNYTCLALQSNEFDLPRPLIGVDISVVGASARFGGAGALDTEVRRSRRFYGHLNAVLSTTNNTSRSNFGIGKKYG